MALLTIWYLIAFVGLSIGVAVLIHRIRRRRLQVLLPLLLILPVIIPAVVLILLWKFIYDSTIGPLNAILIGVGLQDWTHAWLAEPKIAIYAVMFRNFPWIDGVSVLILLAGLQAIPAEIVESGLLDGASGWRRLRYIELPLITGQIKLLVVLTIMWGVQEYSAVWAMTAGRANRLDPGARDVDVFQRLPHQPHGLRIRNWRRHVLDHSGGDDSEHALYKVPGILEQQGGTAGKNPGVSPGVQPGFPLGGSA